MTSGIQLNQLAVRYAALEAVDKSEFQRKGARSPVALCEQQGFPMGHHKGKDGLRPLGSRLPMSEAKTELWNFLSDRIRKVVKREVCDPLNNKGKLFGKPRIFNDLLSSQPLCFNLFGELQCDLRLATNVLRTVSDGRIHEVTGIEFEHPPKHGDPIDRPDKSAFDVFVNFVNPSGGKGFVGIEVKYHENLSGKASTLKSNKSKKYNEVVSDMGCFMAESMTCLKTQPLQQIWRDHMLAGLMRNKGDGFEDGYFLLLHPKANLHCTSAVDAYRKCLNCSDTFASLTLEVLVAEIKKHTDAEWVNRLYDRYLDFGKVERMLAV